MKIEEGIYRKNKKARFFDKNHVCFIGRKANKKGVSHIEMVISFILFFIFVSFLLIFLRPTQTNVLSASVVSGLHDSFKGEAETNLTQMFLKAPSPFNGDEGCFYITLDNSLFKLGYYESSSLTKDVENELVSSEFEPKKPSGTKLSIDANETYYKVLLSPDFVDSDINCGDNELAAFKIGSVDEKQIISYESLKRMKIKYETDYENLKLALDFPEAFDFAIVSTDLKEIDMQGIIPDQAQVQAADFIEEVLFSNGTVINERFTVKVW